jgi:hypothetical protein
MPITFPNTTVLVLDYLNDSSTIPFYTRVPDPRPKQWGQLRRSGGTKILVRDRVALTFTVWDSEDENRCAFNLAEVRSLIHELQGGTALGPMVYEVVETSGPIDDVDDQSGDFTFWFRAELVVRAN